MTGLSKKILANRIIIGVLIALLAAAIGLRFINVPTPRVKPADNVSVGTTDGLNGATVTYTKAENGLGQDYSRTDAAISGSASSIATPAADERLTVIVTLDGTPMMQYATDRGVTVREALASADGKANLQKLTDIRQRALNGLSKYIIDYRYDYTTVTNAFCATVRYGDIAEIEKNDLVTGVIVSQSYLAPQVVTENLVEVYESGIFDSSRVGYDGTGTVVAVVDTGTDYTHEVFDMELDPDTIVMTKDDVAEVASVLTATSLSAGNDEAIDEDDLYIKTKLPFAYDYADGDTNVYPNNSHGTHVAGIIAGKSDVITGVAPGAQIATFKVFSDYRSGALTEWILAALNDAVTLGVDAINMSLGTSCGFSREVDEEQINTIYDSINAAGICLVVAASNDASSAQASTWGNTNLATNPDSGTVGSPASYPASLAVASVSGVKTKYFMFGEQEIYFAESRLVGKTDPNDFVAGVLGDKTEGEYEFVLVPGIGLPVNYSRIDVKGKIALIKRGNTSFEEKVRVAHDAGAIAAIVYNNVSGTISMSVGTKLVMPSCFITMDLAEQMVAAETGKIRLSSSYLAGPFMSDFSSWGCLPDLELAPDITAHGGEIYSAVAGGDAYDKYSGTSMACPNLAGALLLVRQYVKENNVGYTSSQSRDESYSRMMSTATIVRNQEGNPYSPRKQGAGLCDISNSINTKAYLTVDGSNKPKLSLKDDPQKTGVYTLNFNIVNTSGSALSYTLDPYVMTESMSSDGRTVAEKAYMMYDTVNTYSVQPRSGSAMFSGNMLTVGGYAEAAITATITLSAADRQYLDSTFANGMFVEGYMRLNSNNLDGISLSIPFLAFYGDWRDAPMLDISAYEVGESEADDSILADEKLVADVYGTLPYAGFYSPTSDDKIGYWGMGSFAFIPSPGYDNPPTQEKYASLTTNPDGNYLFYMVSAGLLRGAKHVDMEIRNSATGELLWSGVDYNARKSHASGEQTGGMVLIELNITELDLPNNAKYTFSMECFLDWKDQNGEYTYGNNNKFSFEFTIDNEAPELTGVNVRKVESGTSYRYYLDLTAYDNHYLQGYSISTFSGKDKDGELVDADSLTDGVIPVNSNYNKDTVFTYDITNQWSAVMANGGNLYVSFYDYAKNSQAFEIKVEQEKDVHIAKTRTAAEGYSIVPNQQIDLSDYITVTANPNAEDPSYIEGYWTEDLIWESADPSYVEVDEHSGVVTGVKATEAGKPIKVTVRTADTDAYDESDTDRCLSFNITVAGAALDNIAVTGVEMSAVGLTLERGETAFITATVKPANTTVKDITLDWLSTSSNVRIVSVSEDGLTAEIYATDSGSATVRATVNGTRISGYTSVRVKAEYEMYSNVFLRSYTGRGDENGVVEIPDDLGIVYIYQSAFFGNKYVKKVIIPEGVTTIYRAAFMNCSALEEVVLPSTVETIDEIVFANDNALKKVNLGKVKTIGARSFWGCGLTSLDLSSCTYIDEFAFIRNNSLTELDLSRVGIIGGGAFSHCNGLERVRIPANTSMSYSAPYNDGGVFGACEKLKTVDIYSNNIGKWAFYGCKELTKVNVHSDVDIIDEFAFAGCTSLENVTFYGSVYRIGTSAFNSCSSLTSFKLPKGLTILGSAVFMGTGNLNKIVISSGANLKGLSSASFYCAGVTVNNDNTMSGSGVTSFVVEDGNKYLSTVDGVVYDRAQKELVLYPWARTVNASDNGGVFKIPDSVVTVGAGAFSFARLNAVDLNNVEYIEADAFSGSMVTRVTGYDNVKYIGDSAFEASAIRTLPLSDRVRHIGDYAFADCNDLSVDFVAPTSIEYIGNYAFAGSASSDGSISSVPIKSVSFAGSKIASVGTGAFAYNTQLTTIDFGNLDSISAEMFRGATKLAAVTVPATVKSMGAGAFEDCTSLYTVSIASQLTSIPERAFKGISAVTVSLPLSVGTIGASAFEGSKVRNIVLDSIERIGAKAFASTNIAIVAADSVVYVGDGAFKDCANLTSVRLADATYIGASAFENCVKLASVSLDNAESIGSAAFAGCSTIASVSLPSAKTVGDKAFDGATALASVSLDSAESIGYMILSGTAVESLALPATVSKISEGAFAQAKSLADIEVNKSNKTFMSQDGVLYIVNDAGFYTLVCYPAGKTDTEFTLATRTIKLGTEAFSANEHLQKLNLPIYLQVIGVRAMSGMTSLDTIVIDAVDAPSLESKAVITYLSEEESEDEGYEDRLAVDTYVNIYDNFNFALGEQSSLRIIVPYNASGYDNRIWKNYVGECIERSDVIHADGSTLDYIERVIGLPDVPASADMREINTLLRLYNLLAASQKSIVLGNYDYKATSTDGSVLATLPKAYYTELFAGTDYYARLKAVAAKAGKAVGGVSSDYSGAEVYIDSDEKIGLTVTLAVVAVTLAMTVAVFTAVVIKRRGADND